MLSVRLDQETEQFLETLAKETHRPKSYFVKQALSQYMEDMRDYHEAQTRSSSQDRHLIGLEELEKALGL